MRTLIVGIGALGGVLAARLAAARVPVSLATRTRDAAHRLKQSGLTVTGVGGTVSVPAPEVAALDSYRGADPFDVVLLATKAMDAVALAPSLVPLLGTGGTLLPIQNGAVAERLARIVPGGRVLGGISNLGATMVAPGAYEQRNAGHLLVGELSGGDATRPERIRAWLGAAVEVRVTANFVGAVWSKLLVNCAGTTIGALAGSTMREFMRTADGRELFTRTYDEALSVASASGARPERMLVDPIPPPRPGDAHDAWVAALLAAYGDAKPSMLQDLERHRPTEIDFINGHVVDLGREVGVATPVNAAIVETVHALGEGRLAPGPAVLGRVLEIAGAPRSAAPA